MGVPVLPFDLAAERRRVHQAAGFTLTIERHGGSEEVGGLDFLPVN